MESGAGVCGGRGDSGAGVGVVVLRFLAAVQPIRSSAETGRIRILFRPGMVKMFLHSIHKNVPDGTRPKKDG